MPRGISFENIQFEKINTNRNECLKHDHKSMFMSKIQRQITFSGLFFTKIYVNRTELRNTRQKIINYCDSSENMKNIREKNIRIHHIDKSQEFFVFHHHQKIESKTDQMIKKI